MQITIHRGTHQIGGCVTEISSGRDKVFIDFGADLPGSGGEIPPGPIPGLTFPDGSRGALFFTHYHGDHVGRLREVRTGLPVYMGRTAKAVYQRYARRTQREDLAKIDAISGFSPLETLRVGSISVTPLMIDHSAFDAYMFLVEGEDKRVLHTGDFRIHGFRGNKTAGMLRRYAPGIDCMVCETTNLSRTEGTGMTERELQEQARHILRENNYVFVYCSSTNIDRIAGFYHATPPGKLFLCDGYQKELLEVVQAQHRRHSGLYDFTHIRSYGSNLDERMEKQGFCMLIRQGTFFARLMERYKGRSKVIYSMWSGYLSGETRNEGLAAFLQGYELTFLHTGGHASAQDLVGLYHAVQPRLGLIPIHGTAPEGLRALLPEEKLLLLQDGETLTI